MLRKKERSYEQWGISNVLLIKPETTDNKEPAI